VPRWLKMFARHAEIEFKRALYTYFHNEEEAEAHAKALVDGLLRGDFDTRFALTELALRIALREQRFPDDFIEKELVRIKLDLKMLILPYLPALKNAGEFNQAR